jgi:hypothetical protein
MLRRALGHSLAFLRLQLGPQPRRALEMKCHEFVRRARANEQLSKLLVQICTPQFRCRFVDPIAKERMREAVGACGGEDTRQRRRCDVGRTVRAALDDELSPGEQSERRSGRRSIRCQRRDTRVPEFATHDRTSLRDRPLLRRETVDPGLEHGLDAGWKLIDVTSLRDVERELQDQKRIALGVRENSSTVSSVSRGGAQQHFRRLARQRGERKPRVAISGGQIRCHVEHLRPCRGEDGNTRDMAQRPEELEHGGLRPVNVLGDEHDLALGAQRCEQRSRSLVDGVGRGRDLAAFDREPEMVRAIGVEEPQDILLADRVEPIGQQPIGDLLPVRRTAAPVHVAGRPIDHFGKQT